MDKRTVLFWGPAVSSWIKKIAKTLVVIVVLYPVTMFAVLYLLKPKFNTEYPPRDRFPNAYETVRFKAIPCLKCHVV